MSAIIRGVGILSCPVDAWDFHLYVWRCLISGGDSYFKERPGVSRTKRESKGSPKAANPPQRCGPEGPAVGAKRPHAAEGCEGERSETVVPEATD